MISLKLIIYNPNYRNKKYHNVEFQTD